MFVVRSRNGDHGCRSLRLICAGAVSSRSARQPGTKLRTMRSLTEGHERDMRRNPRIISLYDKPLHPRRAYARHEDASQLGTTLLSCVALTLATVGFFWGYDAIVHRDILFVPSLAHADTTADRPVRAFEPPVSDALESLVPDMNAPEVVRANADVPPSAFQGTFSNETRRSPIPLKAVISPKKKTHAARQISREARKSYASEPAFFRPAPVDSW